MIVYRAELWSANTGKRTHLGTAVLYNDGTGTKEIGNYGLILGPENEESVLEVLRAKAELPCATVKGFKRLKRRHWDLLGEALQNYLEKVS